MSEIPKPDARTNQPASHPCRSWKVDPKTNTTTIEQHAEYQQDTITRLTAENERLRARVESLESLGEKKQRKLEGVCEESGHDWTGDGERCGRCGISDSLAQYTTPLDATKGETK